MQGTLHGYLDIGKKVVETALKHKSGCGLAFEQRTTHEPANKIPESQTYRGPKTHRIVSETCFTLLQKGHPKAVFGPRFECHSYV